MTRRDVLAELDQVGKIRPWLIFLLSFYSTTIKDLKECKLGAKLNSFIHWAQGTEGTLIGNSECSGDQKKQNLLTYKSLSTVTHLQLSKGNTTGLTGVTPFLWCTSLIRLAREVCW